MKDIEKDPKIRVFVKSLGPLLWKSIDVVVSNVF